MKKLPACDPLFPQLNVAKSVGKTLQFSQSSVKLKASELSNGRERGNRGRKPFKRKV